MRVLHVIPSLAARTGGPAVSVVEASRALAACGVDTTIATTDLEATASSPQRGRIGAAALPDGSDELDIRLFPARWPKRLAFSPQLYGYLQREAGAFDVVHIHSLFLFPQLAGYLAAQRHNVPYVVSPRGALDPWLRRRGRVRKAVVGRLWQRAMLSRAAALVLASEGEARLTDDIAPAVPRAVVHNGIHWSELQGLTGGGPFRDRHLDGRTGPIVLSLGRLARKKGHDVLIRSFARATRDRTDVLLVLAGPDDEGLTSSLRQLAAAEGVAERTFFPGMLRGEEKLGAFAAADVWALASHTENFAVAVAEALAVGLPSVLSDAINIAPEAATARAAVVCAPTVEEFAPALASLLGDDARRAELGSNARAFARRYDWSAVAPSLAAVYERVAAGATP